MRGWFDITTASIYCCTSKRTVEMWIKGEGLRYSRVRGKRLIKKEWLDAFLEAHEKTNNHDQMDAIIGEVLKGVTG